MTNVMTVLIGSFPGAATCAILGCLALGASGVLIRPARAQDLPDPRAHHEIVYHAGQRQVYLIGGSTRRENGYHFFNDVWFWNGTHWARADALPFPRSSHRAVYHAERNSLILFGGGFDRTFGEDATVWEWDGRDWRGSDGTPGAGRGEHGMCYDRERARVVVFGGWNSANELSGATWEWTGDSLAEMAGAGPSPRAGHAFVYDPRRERCLLFGGQDSTGYLADTWEWDGTAWRRIEASGPSPRWFLGAATDDAGRRVVIFGGSGPGGELGDTWAWDGARWQLLAQEGPPPRGSAKLAFDGTHVILFGGRAPIPEGFRDLNDTWELRGHTWHRRR